MVRDGHVVTGLFNHNPVCADFKSLTSRLDKNMIARE